MGNVQLYGGLEGGGTKFVCAVGTGPDKIVEETRIPTTTPEETIRKAIEFFKKFKLAAIGMGMFGPVDLNQSSSTYGFITSTPKAGWANTNILGAFRQAFELPLAYDTDVNAAAFGEFSWIQENQKLASLAYYTIGTGIGGGFIINGEVIHGLTHPEAGHVRIPHDRKVDPFPGVCPYHGDCLEGLANGPALATRWRKPAEELPQGHPAWELEATYIAHALASMICILSPQRIILGGGVMQQQALFPLIRKKVRAGLNGYIASPVIAGSMEDFITPPGLGKRSGILGAIAMAKKQTGSQQRRLGQV